jgi:hypothetical protein
LNNSPAKTGLVLKLSSSIKRRAEPGKKGEEKQSKKSTNSQREGEKREEQHRDKN